MTATNTGLPGGVAISHVSVYDWPAADGVCGGTPHMHLACSEAYVVTGGRGAVQTLTTSGYEVTPLRAGTVAWFTPGTIHRLVNEGDLRITVLMQNSGLPEAGDAVLTLPPEYLIDPEAYARATVIPPDAPEEEQERVARARRDLALEGYRALCEAEGPETLAAFHRAAAALVRPRIEEWRERWHRGAEAAAAVTGVQLDSLERGEYPHLADAVVRSQQPATCGKFGMCGRLDVYEN
ncbi:mannose-6-phosphate isomerase-like protein (cupin superfamily) [Streptomyces sp. B4I13]|uniref:cupin domain-containing protein n=1 Tax=Streptomyces sp. B4I13 TaxID=3042271 RepID=UPI0027894AA1|nr:cupin domain-containing protein [Streptomyces sp. B4I13]MDQ0961188.1 mannose-6-phosphate isomerase-like protein (cupin superfamily) [Streptomyces sp. B4I13]